MRKPADILAIAFILFLIGVYLFLPHTLNKEEGKLLPTDQSTEIDTDNISAPEKIIEPLKVSEFQSPLDQAAKRVTKKPFGIWIDSQTSPVQPENFSGYHTGTDFEIFPEETETEVTVRAVCSGKLIAKKYATGYGGVAVQSCTLDNNPITIIYGHLKLISLEKETGERLVGGDPIGVLGKGFSAETDGERKHLHLGFHQGMNINILGYVSNKKDLSAWIDPCLYLCEK